MRSRAFPTRTIGIASAVILVLVLLVVFTQSFRHIVPEQHRVLHVRFPAAPQLYPGDQVRFRGREEGSVKRVEAGPDGTADVTLELEPDIGPIYKNATARISWKTLLGGSFYVDIDRGTPGAGPLGDGRIPPAQTARQVELEDVQRAFRGRGGTGLQQLFGALGEGLSDAPAPAAALRGLTTLAPSLTVTARSLRGVPHDDDVRRLVRTSAATLAALDAPDDDLQKLVQATATTLTVTANRAADIEQSIAVAPDAEASTRRTLRRLERTLSVVDGFNERVRPAVAGAEPALRDLRGALTPTSRLLQTARLPLVALRPAAEQLAAAARPARQTLTQLRPDLDSLDDTILPYINRRDPVTEKPTSTMIGAAASHLSGLAAQEDVGGTYLRFPTSGGTTTLPLPCATSLVDPSAAALLACDDLQTAASNLLSYLPQIRFPKGGR